MRESRIENYLARQVKAAGGRCLKFVSPGRRGVTDRLVQWPRMPIRISPGYINDHRTMMGRTHYVEVKAPGEKPRAEQLREHRWLRRNGFDVFVLDTKAKVDNYIRRNG